MDYFFTMFFSILYKILAGLFVIILILDVARRLSRRKLIDSILHSPEEKRQIYIRMDSKLVSVYKMLLWVAPIDLLVFASATYYFLPRIFYFTIAIAMFNIVILEDYLYKRSFLKAINK